MLFAFWLHFGYIMVIGLLLLLFGYCYVHQWLGYLQTASTTIASKPV